MKDAAAKNKHTNKHTMDQGWVVNWLQDADWQKYLRTYD